VKKGHAVARLVEALRYKPEGRGFDCRRGHWHFLLINPSGRGTALGSTQLQGHLVGSRGGRCVGVIPSPPSCAYCSEIRATCKSRSPKGL